MSVVDQDLDCENEHNCKAKQHVLLKGVKYLLSDYKKFDFIPVITEEFDKEI